MMTLEEMLALLPDNTVGAIGANDMRAIVTDLFNRDVAVTAGLDAAIAALPASYLQYVVVVTGNEPRPTAGVVFWIDLTRAAGAADPAGMTAADTRIRPSTAVPAVAPEITTLTISSLVVGTPFSQTLAATGPGPITWTVTAGALPAGLALNADTGVLFGTPSASGAYTFTVTATNPHGSDAQPYSGTVTAIGEPPANITPTTLAAMTVGAVFSADLSAAGSTPLVWGISAGALPAGLGINSSSGLISGTPTAQGGYTFTVEAANGFGSTTRPYTGTVAPPAAETEYTIFGGLPVGDGALTAFTDADPGSWLAHQFYVTATPPRSTWILAGVRLWIPTGSPHIGQAWSGAYHRRPDAAGGVYTFDEFPGFQTAVSANGTSTDAPAVLVAGWNDCYFDVEAPANSLDGLEVGVRIGDGTRYQTKTDVTTSSIQERTGTANLYLAAAEFTPGNECRVIYRDTWTTVQTIRWYGIDVIVRVP